MKDKKENNNNKWIYSIIVIAIIIAAFIGYIFIQNKDKENKELA